MGLCLPCAMLALCYPYLPTMMVHVITDLSYAVFKHTTGGWVCDHHSSQVLPMLLNLKKDRKRMTLTTGRFVSHSWLITLIKSMPTFPASTQRRYDTNPNPNRHYMLSQHFVTVCRTSSGQRLALEDFSIVYNPYYIALAETSHYYVCPTTGALPTTVCW